MACGPMVHLKVRTEYSLGLTFAPVGRVIQRLKELGVTAAGIVDQSSWGHVHWERECKAAGIRPLFGIECVVTDNDERSTRMWFLARTTEGLSELYRAISKAHKQALTYRQKTIWSFGSKARLYRRDVEQMSSGIVKFAGDITDGPWLKSIDAVVDLNPSSTLQNTIKKRLASEYGLRVVHTADNAYVYSADKSIFEVVSDAGTKVTSQAIDAIETTQAAVEIADACAGLVLPRAKQIAVDGDYVFVREPKNEEYRLRLQREIDVVDSKNFKSYFLVVADMVQYAKKHMLVGPGRGSAAGSLLCYLLGITEIDPIEHGLSFERFIDPSRPDLPDIDLDFPDDKRQLVFDYMATKYGVDHVAHIGTITQLKAKSALVHVCKALRIPPEATSPVKYNMLGTLAETLTKTEQGRNFVKQYPQASCLSLIEGHASHSSVHAAGLLVSNAPISDFAVVDEEGIAHTVKGAAEQLGLLKIDVLGLRTLGVLEDSGVAVDWYNLPVNDPKALEIFNSKRFCGIFQFDGAAMRNVANDITFESLGEISAVTALARPGPLQGGVTQKYLDRKNGSSYNSLHPAVEQILAETFGLPVYQEQVMAIARDVGGFSWEDTNAVRKAIGKSMGAEALEPFYEKFLIGAVERGLEERTARQTWDMVTAFGGYGMNKSHTYSYALLSYWCAYLKAHHPLEFAAANLRHAKDEDSAVALLREIVNEGYEYVPFDIQKSKANWSVADGKLIGGFLSLRGIGEKTASKLLEARDKGTLSEAQFETINKSTNVFLDIFPLSSRYESYYSGKENVASQVVKIRSLDRVPDHKEERVFIGELVFKKKQDANSEVNKKKRGGAAVESPSEYLDLRFKDDTGEIGGRLSRWDFPKTGHTLLNEVPIGAHLLVRASFYNGIRYAFVKSWRRLDE